jgi:hypothetical protein
VVNNVNYNARGQTLTAAYANGVTSSFAYSDARGG